MRNSNNKIIAEINVIPYVDVMLVLVVIFMITTPLLSRGVTVDLPQANTEKITSKGKMPILVSVDRNGDYFLNIADHPTHAIPNDKLQLRVAAALKLDPNRQVLVRGDSSARYNNVLQVMALLQKAGASSVGLEAKPL